jgi:hypothetical protein
VKIWLGEAREEVMRLEVGRLVGGEVMDCGSIFVNEGGVSPSAPIYFSPTIVLFY